MVTSIQRRFQQVARQVGKPSPDPAGDSPSLWLSTQDLAVYLRLGGRQRPREAALGWAKRHRVASAIVNREHRFARRDVERILEAQARRAALK